MADGVAPRILVAYCDGAIERSAPAWGFVVYELVHLEGPLLENLQTGVIETSGRCKLLHEGSGLCDPAGPISNNVSEYQAVAEALAWIQTREPLDLRGLVVLLRGDSMLWVNQLAGRSRILGGAYQAMALVARERWRDLQRRGAVCRTEWIPREKNREADQLSRKAYPWRQG